MTLQKIELKVWEKATIVGYEKLSNFYHVSSNKNFHFFENENKEICIMSSYEDCFTIEKIVNGESNFVDTISTAEVDKIVQEFFNKK